MDPSTSAREQAKPRPQWTWLWWQEAYLFSSLRGLCSPPSESSGLYSLKLHSPSKFFLTFRPVVKCACLLLTFTIFFGVLSHLLGTKGISYILLCYTQKKHLPWG